MGTFHKDTHELHGITVVIDAADGSLIVGRFHEQDDTHALLLDADTHREGEGGKSNAQWLADAAKWGHWPRQKQLFVRLADIKQLRRLGPL
ncbi:hypothetical protein PLCT1_01665 [Planctomycetaceae bacterium]|nr:hypothetical protein PLCT1_01665 [Planctomycetaceae bacterium]